MPTISTVNVFSFCADHSEGLYQYRCLSCSKCFFQNKLQKNRKNTFSICCRPKSYFAQFLPLSLAVSTPIVVVTWLKYICLVAFCDVNSKYRKNTPMWDLFEQKTSKIGLVRLFRKTHNIILVRPTLFRHTPSHVRTSLKCGFGRTVKNLTSTCLYHSTLLAIWD